MADLMQQRRDTAANWTANDPVLEDGQIGAETDHPERIKVGDGSAAWSALDYVGTGLGGGGGGSVNDLIYVCPSSQDSIDEFADDSLDSGWVQVDKAGGAGRIDWQELGDVLSAHVIGGDAAQELHALMLPLSGVGGALAVGDAIVTRFTAAQISSLGNYLMAGVCLADGHASGAGVQQVGFTYGLPNGYAYNTPFTNYTAQGSFNQDNSKAIGSTTWLRLVKLAGNTWRTDTSPNGIHWVAGPSTTPSAFIPTEVGLMVSSWGTGTESIVSFNLLRRDSGVS